MDIARPSNARRKRMRQIAFATGAILVVGLVSYVLAGLKPAAPTVEAGTVWRDTVKRGPMLRQVRGLGTLVPEDIRWIPATTQGRVERIILRPGTAVNADSVILELSNPQLDQELRNAELQLQSAQASLANLRVQVQNELLNQRATSASIEADFSRAKMQVQMNEALAKDQPKDPPEAARAAHRRSRVRASRELLAVLSRVPRFAAGERLTART